MYLIDIKQSVYINIKSTFLRHIFDKNIEMVLSKLSLVALSAYYVIMCIRQNFTKYLHAICQPRTLQCQIIDINNELYTVKMFLRSSSCLQMHV